MGDLPVPRTAAGVEGMAALVADPTGSLLAFDYDGTLAPIVDQPARAVPERGAVPALAALAARVGGALILTGRPALDVVRLGGLSVVPGLVVLGLYGAQRWPPVGPTGTAESGIQAALDAARDALDPLLAAAPAGTWLEDKGGSLAVHVRRTADPASALDSLREPIAHLARDLALRVEPGRYVLELRPPGVDKGAALEAHTREVGARAVLFAGDDLGDLAAFAAVERLRSAGVPGVTVASVSEEAPEVAQRADLVVAGPVGVVDLLTSLAAALG